MTADTRVSITVDTGNAESGLNRLRSAFGQLGSSTTTTQTDLLRFENAIQQLAASFNRFENEMRGIQTALTTLANRFSTLIGDINRLGTATNGTINNFNNINRTINNTTNNTNHYGNAVNNITNNTNHLNRTINNTTNNFNRLGDTINHNTTVINNYNNAANNTGGIMSSAANKILGFVAAFGGLAIVGHQLVETQREFDKLNAQLITATGSTENAAKAFKELQAFAKTTPYDLAQSVEGFAKLKNLGLDPSIDSLKSFGNTAAAMGKDLNQMIEAVADATTGEFERLKEFGIKSKSEGDKVTFTFQGVSKTVGKNAEEIQQYLLDIGNTQFAGAMDARAKTLDGAISSLGDSWEQFKLSLSQGGIGDVLTEAARKAGDALDTLTQKMQQPENVQMFKDALDGIGIAFGVIGGVIGAVATGFVAISDAVGSNPDAFIAVGSGLAAIAVALGAISLYAAVPAIIAGISSAMVGFGGALTVALGPVGLIVMAIGALVAAGVYLYRNWDTVKAKATEIWGSVSDSVGDAVQSITDWFSNAGKEIQNEFNVIGNGVESAMSSISSTVSSVWNGLKSVVSSAMSAVSATVTSAWNGIKNAVSNVVNAIKSVVSAGLSVLSNIFSTQFNVIKTVVSTAMNAIKALVQGDIQGVKDAFSSGFSAIIDIVKPAVSNIVSAFGNLGTQLFEIGVQAVQGLANGIKSRISAVGAEARNLASNVANSIRSVLDIHSPSRVTHALGEHAGQGLANGLKAKQSEVAKQAEQLSQQVIDNIASLKRDIALTGKDNNPLAALNYDIENGKYAGVSSSLLDNLKTATEAKQIATELYQANQSVTNSIADMNRQIALFGNDNPLSAFLYDMQNTDKYVGATAEKLQMMASKIQQLETLKQTKASEDAFSKLGTDLAQESPAAKLTAEYEQRLAIVDQYEQLHTDKVAEAEAMRKQVKESYTQASNSLMLTQYEGLFSGVAGITKSAFGEQSKAYRAMFAVQKAFSIAQSIMAIQTSVAKAMSVGFPANIPLIGQAISQGAGILSTLRGVQAPAIGQAHDGIMSVPKSGTWNLEKGERVLPSHTAKAMDKKLEQSGNNVNVNIINNAGVPVQQTQDSNGDIRVIIGEELAKQLPQHVNDEYSDFNQSLKRKYHIQRRL